MIGFAQQLGVESELVASPGLTPWGKASSLPWKSLALLPAIANNGGLESSPRGGASTRCQRLYRL